MRKRSAFDLTEGLQTNSPRRLRGATLQHKHALSTLNGTELFLPLWIIVILSADSFKTLAGRVLLERNLEAWWLGYCGPSRRHGESKLTFSLAAGACVGHGKQFVFNVRQGRRTLQDYVVYSRTSFISTVT